MKFLAIALCPFFPSLAFADFSGKWIGTATLQSGDVATECLNEEINISEYPEQLVILYGQCQQQMGLPHAVLHRYSPSNISLFGKTVGRLNQNEMHIAFTFYSSNIVIDVKRTPSGISVTHSTLLLRTGELFVYTGEFKQSRSRK